MPRRRWVSVWIHTHAIFVVVHILHGSFFFVFVARFFEPFRYDIDIDTDSKSHNVYWLHCRAFIVQVNLCSDIIEFVFARLLEITNLDDLPWARCYYSYGLSTVLHKILCQYRTTNILLYTRYRNEYTHSRNVIIILSFWFQVTLIWTCSVCLSLSLCVYSVI